MAKKKFFFAEMSEQSIIGNIHINKLSNCEPPTPFLKSVNKISPSDR